MRPTRRKKNALPPHLAHTVHRSALVDVAHGQRDLRIHGLPELLALRDALLASARDLGYRIEFDPASSPSLGDLFLIGTTTTLGTTATGAALGGMVGDLLGEAELGVALGALTGLLFGLAQTDKLIDRGWRVRAVYDPHGIPEVLVTAIR